MRGSRGTLERPGLQAASRCFVEDGEYSDRGETGSTVPFAARDVCTLVEDYFRNERYHLYRCAEWRTRTRQRDGWC